MNVLNDDPGALQDSEVPSESSMKDTTRDHKIFSPWFHCGFISWERENDENFSLKGGLVYWAHWKLWPQSETASPHLPASNDFNACSIDQKINEELKPGSVYCVLIFECISSSSERDTETQSLLTLSESSTDEEEEDFLDKQHVIALPWS